MAELNSFLKGIADAIRSKKGTTDKINASNFASEIASISGGGSSAHIIKPGELSCTAVPNTGFVEKIYFNKNLSIDEINSLIKDNFPPDTDWFLYDVVIGETSSLELAIVNAFNMSEGAYSGYICGLLDNVNEGITPIFNTSVAELSAEFGVDPFVGWYSGLGEFIEFNDNVLVDENMSDIGIFNESLSTMFSSTPFKTLPSETIILSGEYDGTTVNVDSLSAIGSVPNTGTVENVYVNTSLTVDEVNSLLDSITFTFGGAYEYIISNADETKTIQILNASAMTEGAYPGYVIAGIIIDGENYNIIPIFNSSVPELVAEFGVDPFEGWYSGFNGVFEFNDIAVDCGGACGANNEELLTLFSITPKFEKVGEDYVIDLNQYIGEQKLPLKLRVNRNYIIPKGTLTITESGDVDVKKYATAYVDIQKPSGEIEIKENGNYDVAEFATANVNILNPSIEIPKIAVPNSGYVEKVYFNTNLTKDEVVNILSKLSFISVGSTDAYWALDSETTTILITRQYGVYKITVTVGTTDTILFKSDTGGWKTNAVLKLNPLYINETVNSSLSGYSVGAYNSKIANLLSINLISFEDEIPIELSGTYTALYMEISDSGETDIKPFITNKQLPLKIYVEDKLLQLIKATKSCAYLFQNYTETDFNKFIKYEDTSNATSFSHMYKNCTATSFPELNTSNGIDFSGMYLNCANVTILPTITTTKGTNFSSMYEGCKLLTEVPAMSTNSSVNFSKMFKNCESLTNLPSLSGTSVTDFSSMYEGCKVVTTFPTQYTDYGKIFSNMYKNCTSAITLPELNTSNGTDFSGMYNNCLNATSFPALDTSNGTNFNRMYYNCRAIVNLPELNTSKGTDLSYMYYYCINATNFPSLDTSNCINFNGLYCYCKKATSLPELDTGSGVSFAELYSGCESLTSVPMLDTSRGTTFSDMYSGCSNVVDFPLINTSKGINFTGMYSNCSSAKTLPDIDTSNGIGFNYMFRNCESLTAFPNINTSKGTSFVGMYWGCPQTEFPLIDTSNGTNFKEMYYVCRNATSFPAINTSKGTNFMSMYESCTNAISFPPLNTDNGTEFSYMFSSCGKAKLIDISRFSVTSSKNAQQTFDGCNSLKALIIRSFGDYYYISSYTFRNCYRMLGTVNTTYNPEGLKDGYVYVPRDIIETLQSKEYWSTLQFRALEDYTVDGTTTGEFDNAKAGLV